MKPDPSVKPAQPKSAPAMHATDGKIPYPKHVWSPAGGWYSQPANWKANTAIMLVVMFGITAVVWKVGADLEVRTKMPEKGRFFPSRWWSKQIIEHERALERQELERQQLERQQLEQQQKS